MNEKWSIGDGKNNAEWCVFKGCVCVASCSTEHGIFISEAQNIATKMNEIDSMRQQLAAALAACKLKDEALKHIALIDLGRDTLPTDFCMNVLSVRKALAIQPDDSALKAWLGEPVGEVKRHTGSLKDMAIIVWAGQQPEEGTKLYSPKGLK